ncbi:hypothetical protein [Acidisphaera sp. L21]|jgi:hypothetical protein|nr:hypothetical protein [Acidisphaera sp. L21]
MTRSILLAALLALAACGAIKPATPGHEPPSASNYNPVSGTTSTGR